MTNITTNDPGRTLPPKLAEFGESLLRIADRAREAQGLEPFGEDMHVFMRARHVRLRGRRRPRQRLRKAFRRCAPHGP